MAVRWVAEVDMKVEDDGKESRPGDSQRGYEVVGRRAFADQTVEAAVVLSGAVTVGVFSH